MENKEAGTKPKTPKKLFFRNCFFIRRYYSGCLLELPIKFSLTIFEKRNIILVSHTRLIDSIGMNILKGGTTMLEDSTEFTEYIARLAKKVKEKGKHNSFYDEPDDDYGGGDLHVPSFESLQRIGLDHLKYSKTHSK